VNTAVAHKTRFGQTGFAKGSDGGEIEAAALAAVGEEVVIWARTAATA
jgi:hypothetical protein